MKQFWATLVVIVFFSTINTTLAQVTIDIDGGQERGVAIAIVPFSEQGVIPQKFHEIVINDLGASGKFDPIDPSRFLSRPTRDEEVQYKDWRLIGTEILVIGEAVVQAGDRYNVVYTIYDVAKKKQIGTARYSASSSQLRDLAHLISDEIYANVTGKQGAFRTKIAFVKKAGNSSSLEVADWDGYGAYSVVKSSQPILSPAWSPDGQNIAFVTYAGASSVIKAVNLSSGNITDIASSSRGFSSAPAWSPDGSSIAYTSSRSGNPEVYVRNVSGGSARKLTNHWGIDTEPAWSPNGGSIIFTSNRSGKPNLYEVNATGGSPRRITFEGKENTEGSYSADGKQLVYVAEGGVVSIMNRSNGRIKSLSSRKLDESPSFAPNGDMVLYATKLGYNGKLVVSSADGRASQTLNFLSGDVREPTWAPYNR